MIHPSAIVHPKAVLDPSVEVGPYAVIDQGVELGVGCVVGPHVYITGLTRIGTRNSFFPGCVIGEAPQDLKFNGGYTSLQIGDGNTFREHVTVHRSNDVAASTFIGSDNLLMAGCHVGHNSRVGSHVIIANGALLGGHVSIEDRAFISGNCLVHQFVRVGALAMMQGGAAISKDLPPYTVARGDNTICGLNVVGLRRAGISPAERLELKQLYHALFRSGLPFRRALENASHTFSSPVARRMIEFVEQTQRGLCSEISRAAGPPDEPDPE